MARYGIRVNAIAPGYIMTELIEWMPEEHRDKLMPRIPMRRWGAKKDFAGIAVYLMSDASGYHTGDSFVIDGAYTIF